MLSNSVCTWADHPVYKCSCFLQNMYTEELLSFLVSLYAIVRYIELKSKLINAKEGFHNNFVSSKK